MHEVFFFFKFQEVFFYIFNLFFIVLLSCSLKHGPSESLLLNTNA